MTLFINNKRTPTIEYKRLMAKYPHNVIQLDTLKELNAFLCQVAYTLKVHDLTPIICPIDNESFELRLQ